MRVPSEMSRPRWLSLRSTLQVLLQRAASGLLAYRQPHTVALNRDALCRPNLRALEVRGGTSATWCG